MFNWIRYINICFLAITMLSYITSFSIQEISNEKKTTVTRLWGKDRYHTACSISQEGWQSSQYVILTTVEGEDKFTDALAGTLLSSFLDAPILLVEKDQLDINTIKEITRLGVSKVYILGGEGIISNNVKKQLEQMNMSVIRLWGKDRYETAVRIASEVGKQKTFKRAILTADSQFQYAVMAAPFAAKNLNPILFCEKDHLPSSTKSALKEWQIKDVEIIGNSTIVSDSIIRELEGMGINTVRIEGANINDTNINLVKKYYSEINGIVLAREDLLVDIAAGMPLAAKKNLPILLIGQNTASAEVTSYITLIKPGKNYIFGGPGVISQNVIDNLIPITASAPQVTGTGNSPGNIANEGITAVQGDWIYFTHISDGKKLYKSKLNGNCLTKLSESIVKGINVSGEWIYCINESDNNKLYKIKTDGTANEKISDDSLIFPNLIDDWIYYTSVNDNKNIYKIKIDGSNRMKLCSDESFFINVSNGWIYYCNNNDMSKIYKIKVDGSGKTKISDDRASYINVVENWVYYSNQDDESRIYKIMTDGTCKTKINNDSSFYLNVSEGFVYYTNGSKNSIVYRIKTTGKDRMHLNFNTSNAVNIAGGWVYYFNIEAQSFYKMKLNGTEEQPVFARTAVPLTIPIL